MKKFTTALAVLMLIAATVSCAHNQPDVVDITTTANTESVTSTSTTTVKVTGGTPPLPVYGGFSDKTEGYTLTVGEKKLLGVSLVFPVSEIEASEEVKASVKNRLDYVCRRVTDYVELLEERYKADYEAGVEYICLPRISVSYVLNYFTTKAMSLTFNYSETNGYGTTTESSVYYNYELGTGSLITYNGIFKDSSVITSMLVEQAGKRTGLYTNYEAKINELISSSWYVSEGKIIFRFNPYDIAPASSGFIIFEFDAGELSSLMSDYGKELFAIA